MCRIVSVIVKLFSVVVLFIFLKYEKLLVESFLYSRDKKF